MIRDINGKEMLTFKEEKYHWPLFVGPDTYAFGYEIKNPLNKNLQFRDEEKFGNGTISGSHGFLSPDGHVTITHYIADANGYHSIVESFTDPSFNLRGRKVKNKNDILKSSTTISSIRTDGGLLERTDPIPHAVRDKILNQYDIDLGSSTSSSISLHPKLVNVLNGNVPLAGETTDIKGEKKIGFFIPTSFPLSPFQVPNNKS